MAIGEYLYNLQSCLQNQEHCVIEYLSLYVRIQLIKITLSLPFEYFRVYMFDRSHT